MRRGAATGVAAVVALLGACTPPLGTPPSLIQQNRIVAVKADQPDALPSSDVTFTALVASPDGSLTTAPLTWAFCITPKPLSENNAVALGCLQDGVTAFGMPGPTATGTLPEDGCSRFGPLAPPAPPGSKDSGTLRPRDADLTGGYYQPVRVTMILGAPDGGDLVAFALQRIQCGLIGASIEVNAEFNDPVKGYHPNRNPKLAGVSGGVDPAVLLPLIPEGVGGGPGMLGVIPPGATIQLRASWPADATESFPVLNTSSRLLDRHGETLRVSWFGSGGSFAHDVVGRGESELWTGLPATDAEPQRVPDVDFVDNSWTAPEAPGIYRIWTVLRDSRGGIDFAAYSVLVSP